MAIDEGRVMKARKLPSAGDVACERLELATKGAQEGAIAPGTSAQEDNAGSSEESLDAILAAALPAPGSRKESRQLKRLRELDSAKRGGVTGQNAGTTTFSTSSSTSTRGHVSGRLVTREVGFDGIETETELYWRDSHLIWSRGGIIHRIFVYDEPIRSATWAWMDSKTGGNTAQNRSENVRASIRVLCIALPTHLAIYEAQSGREYVKKLDFDVLSIVPLDSGVLIQRRAEREDLEGRSRKRFRGSFDAAASLTCARLPSLFLLRRPLDDLEAVHVVDRILHKKLEDKGGRSVVAVSDDIQEPKWFDSTELRVLSAFTLPSKQAPRGVIVLMTNVKSNKLCFYDMVQSSSPLLRHQATAEPLQKQHVGDTHATPIRPVPSRKSSGTSRLPIRSRASSDSRARPSSVLHDRARIPSSVQRHGSGGLTGLFASSGAAAGVANVEEEEELEFEQTNARQLMQLIDDLDAINEERAGPGTRNAQAIQGNAVPRRSARVSSVPVGTGTPYPASAAANLMRTPYVKAQYGASNDTRARRLTSMGTAVGTGNAAAPYPALRQEIPSVSASETLHAQANAEKDARHARVAYKYKKEHQSVADFAEEPGPFQAAVACADEVEIAGLSETLSCHNLQVRLVCDAGRPLVFLFLEKAQRLCVVELLEKGFDDRFSCTRARDFPLTSTSSQPFLSAQAVEYSSLRPGLTDVILTQKGNMRRILLSPFSAGSWDEALDVGAPLKILWPRCSLVQRVFTMSLTHCTIALRNRIYATWVKAMQHGEELDEWATLEAVLVGKQKSETQVADQDAFCRLRFSSSHARFGAYFRQRDRQGRDSSVSTSSGCTDAAEAAAWTLQERQSLAILLHLCAQDALLDNVLATQKLPRIVPLILRLCKMLSWTRHYDYWRKVAQTSSSLPAVAPPECEVDADEPAVFCIVDAFRQAVEEQGTKSSSGRIPERNARLLQAMDGDTETSSQSQRIARTIDSLLCQRLTKGQIPRLPPHIALVVLRLIQHCRDEPSSSWSASACGFIGREDVAASRSLIDTLAGRHGSETTPAQLIGDSQAAAVTHTLSPISTSLFGQDSRLADAVQMLQTKNAVATRGPADLTGVANEDLVAEMQKRTFISITERIKATSIGRGMLLIGTDVLKPMEQVAIPPINTKIRMLCNCIVQHREPDPESPDMEWPEFHNGVAAAMQIDASAAPIESTWIFNQTSDEFTPRKAGFICGLGLRGYLRHLGKVHAHYYLSQRHPMTTMGLLLGISVSFLGSCDPMAKALMSIHLLHTLPSYSKPLKTTILEQSAALLGLGLVFLESSDKWASRMALKAIDADTIVEDESQNKKRACYALSAGFSLGLVCLGHGARSTRDVRDELEHNIVPSLESMIMRFSTDEGSTSFPEKDEGYFGKDDDYSAFEWRLDISATSTPASIALALIYLRSGRVDIANKFALPETPAQLDEIRPELLQMRVLCRALVLWDDIRADTSWLDHALPVLLRFRDQAELAAASESRQLAYWAMRTGAIFSLGLKFAGSNDLRARTLLLDELRRHAAADLRAMTYFQKLRQQALRSAIDVIINSLAMVAAGSGDAELMAVMHKALYKVDGTRYGNHMANSMSLGLLFLGGGRFSLATSNLAVAALVISFFPRYPINSVENYTHLQAYRHLWILAIEQRLVQARDFDSGQAVKVPITLHRGTADKEVVAHDVTPCTLPRLDGPGVIALRSERYLASSFRIGKKDSSRLKTLYCKRKPAYLDHESDPDGRASFAAQRRARFVVYDRDLDEQVEGRAMSGSRYSTSSQDLIENNNALGHIAGMRTLISMLRGRTPRTRVKGEDLTRLTRTTLQMIKSAILDDNVGALSVLMTCNDGIEQARRRDGHRSIDTAIFALTAARCEAFDARILREAADYSKGSQILGKRLALTLQMQYDIVDDEDDNDEMEDLPGS